MCGLVGVAGYISQKEEAVFKRLLELDTIRGPHSTGVLALTSRGETEIVKKVGTPWDLYQYKQFDELMRNSLCVLMGHNRYATKGKINSGNAHPFEHDHIIGAHNGTLRNQSLLLDHKYFEVDSDNIFYSMSKVGVDDTVKVLSGAFALTWYDAELETMNFVRNEERPLFLCESEDKRTVFWASELWMLEVTLGLAQIKYRDPFQPKAGQLFTYPIEVAYAPKAFKDVYVRNLKMYEPPVYTGGHSKHTSTTTTTTAVGKTEVKNTTTGEVTVFNKAKEGEEKKSQKGVRAEDLIMQDQVEFFVSSIRTSEATGQQWVSCFPTQDDCNIELRIYTADVDQFQLLVNSTHLFTGKIRGYCTVGGETYCTLDPRTLTEVTTVYEDEYEEELVVVYGGEIVDESDYDVMVACGCGNCKMIPTVEDSVDLVWLDKINFICGDCKDLPVVKDFLDRASSKQSTKH